MIQNFDFFSQYEVPDYTLCNPDGSKLFNISGIYDRQVSLRYNAVSTIKFSAPKTINNTTMPYYSYLVGKRRIQIPNIGMFIITKVIEKSDGAKIYKEVEAKSLEFELSFRKILNVKGTWKFYDASNQTNSLMHKLLTYMPSWSLGALDPALYNLYRTFNEKDTTVYTFLMREMEQAYQCVFTFDTFNKTINAQALTNAITTTDIYLSYENLLKNVDIDESSDNIVTALSVYGKDDLTINQVNPLGNDIIYNFEYYKKPEWMSSGLITVIDAWKNKIGQNQASYSTKLTELMTYQREIYDLQTNTTTGLEYLETQLLIAQNALKLAIDAGTTDTLAYQNAVVAAEIAVEHKKVEITEKQSQIEVKKIQLTAINNICKIEANFTTTQFAELNNFIFAGTYDNRNFLQTDEMTLQEVQQMALDLYAQGVIISNKVSQPIYEFSLDVHNFIFIKYFQPFIDQLALGSSLYVQLEEGKSDTLFAPIILGFDYNYDEPTSFKFLLSNRMRLANSEIELGDINSDADRTISQVKYSAGDWSDWVESGQQTVNQFIDEALNASLTTLMSTKDQEISLTPNGLIGRQKVGTAYSPNQIWLTSNQIAFTNDAWGHVKMALGEITFGGQQLYGVVCDALVGRMIIGNSLVIQNNVNSELATFLVDAAGMKATNMNLELSNAKNIIDINPNVGILIKKTNGAEVLSIGTDGNIRISYTSIYDLPPYPVIPPPPTWDTLTGKPLYVIDEAAPTKGLHISGSHLGYYEAPTGWRTYMDNSGNFYLKGTGSNDYLSWDVASNTLTIKGRGIFTGNIASATGYPWTSVSGIPEYVSTTNLSDGLHINSTFLGYIKSGAWKTYMNNSGGFYLSGTGGNKLEWNGSTLNIVGGGTFSGALSAATGTFTGVLQGASGTFTGNITAANLIGAVQWSQIQNAPIPTSQINGGTGYSLGGFTIGSLSGNRIYGGRFTFPGGSIGQTQGADDLGLSLVGDGTVYATSTLALAGANKIYITSGTGTYVTGGLYKDGIAAGNQVFSVDQNDSRYAWSGHGHSGTYASYYHTHGSITASRSFRSYAGGQINMSVTNGIITALS